MIYCGISLLVNTRRLEIILKYLNFIKILERIFTFKPPPVRQRTIIWVFGYLGIWLFGYLGISDQNINK